MEELVALDDHPVAGAALLVPTRTAGRGQAKHFTADHLLRDRRGELGQLLSNDPHLLTVELIGRQQLRLFAKRRADPSASGGFPERRAHGLGVVQAIGTHDVESGRRSLV